MQDLQIWQLAAGKVSARPNYDQFPPLCCVEEEVGEIKVDIPSVHPLFTISFTTVNTTRKKQVTFSIKISEGKGMVVLNETADPKVQWGNRVL